MRPGGGFARRKSVAASAQPPTARPSPGWVPASATDGLIQRNVTAAPASITVKLMPSTRRMRALPAPIAGSSETPLARARSTQRWHTATLMMPKNISPRTADASSASDSSHTPRSNSGVDRRVRHSAHIAGIPVASASTSS